MENKPEEVKQGTEPEEAKPEDYEILPDGTIPEETPPSSAEEPKPEEVFEPPKAETSPLEQYIEELEKEVGTRRGENETPEAYALRLEITKLRRERKEERKALFDNKEEPKEKPKEEQPEVVEDEILANYEPAEISNFEKLFDAIAKKKGMVRKDELQTTSWFTKAEDILESFQAKHKEYSDDALWDRFKYEFQSGKYNTHPQNPKLLSEIFEEIHNKLVPSKTISPAIVAAGKEKIQAAAHGGTTVPNKPRKPIDPDLKAALKGFSDEELEAMSQ